MSVDAPVKPELDAAEIAELAITKQPQTSGPSRALKVWNFAWPKLMAIGIVVALWQFAYWQEWKPHFLLPSPFDVFGNLKDLSTEARLWEQVGLTMRRGVSGFAI